MKRDARWRMLLGVALAAVVGGLLVYLLPERARELTLPVDPGVAPHPTAAPPAYAGELHERFQQAAVMLHAGQHEYALAALERVLDLAPDLPEAHVNTGFALLGLERPQLAERHFETAIALRPEQVNAYYGLALAREAAGDLDTALGAMRTFVHLSPPDAEHLRRARAAIWEWEARRNAAPEPKVNPDPQEGGGEPDGV